MEANRVVNKTINRLILRGVTRNWIVFRMTSGTCESATTVGSKPNCAIEFSRVQDSKACYDIIYHDICATTDQIEINVSKILSKISNFNW